jgi:hypothetical protein
VRVVYVAQQHYILREMCTLAGIHGDYIGLVTCAVRIDFLESIAIYNTVSSSLTLVHLVVTVATLLTTVSTVYTLQWLQDSNQRAW